MWPYSAVLQFGDDPVVVGTDDPVVAAAWRPWQVDDARWPAAALVDYGIETKAYEANAGESGIRPLAGLRHGSVALGRSQDADGLVEAFWRVLGAHASAPGGDSVRVDAVPVVTAAGIVLADRSVAGLLPHRRLADRGTPVVPVRHVDITVARSGADAAVTVSIARPLVGGAGPMDAPLVGWLSGRDPMAADESTAGSVAALARSLADHSGGRAGRQRIDRLAQVAAIVPLRLVDGGRAGLLDAVCSLADGEPR